MKQKTTIIFKAVSTLKPGQTTDPEGFVPYRCDVMPYGEPPEFGKLIIMREIGTQGYRVKGMIVNLSIKEDKQGNQYITAGCNS